MTSAPLGRCGLKARCGIEEQPGIVFAVRARHDAVFGRKKVSVKFNPTAAVFAVTGKEVALWLAHGPLGQFYRSKPNMQP